MDILPFAGLGELMAGISGVGVSRLLQWGRDLLVAERRHFDRLFGSGWTLQWGRDLLVAERGEVAIVPQDRTGLQWGRDLLVAERSWGSVGSGSVYARFNGAATC